jgi:hypothetical protein
MTEMYDFHKSKTSSYQKVHQSHIYMLQNLEHVPIDDLREFLSENQEVNIFDKITHKHSKNKIDNFRIQRSLGTEIKSISGIS